MTNPIDAPRPYVPPDVRPAEADRGHGRKPWMDLPDAHFHCWRCGHRDDDLDRLAKHEDTCTGGTQ